MVSNASSYYCYRDSSLCLFFSFLCYALSRHFLHSRFFNHARHVTKHKHPRAHKETHRLLKNNNRLRLSKNTAHLYHIRILVLYACYRLLYKPCVNQTAVAYTYAHHLYTCTWPRVIARIHTHTYKTRYLIAHYARAVRHSV